MADDFTLVEDYFPRSGTAVSSIAQLKRRALTERVEVLYVGDSRAYPDGFGRRYLNQLRMRFAQRGMGPVPTTELIYPGNSVYGFSNTIGSGTSAQTYTATTIPPNFAPVIHSNPVGYGFSTLLMPDGAGLPGATGRGAAGYGITNDWMQLDGSAVLRMVWKGNTGSSAINIATGKIASSAYTFFPTTTIMSATELLSAAVAGGSGYIGKTITLTVSTDASKPYTAAILTSATATTSCAGLCCYRWEHPTAPGFAFSACAAGGYKLSDHLALDGMGPFFTALGLDYSLILIDIGVNDAGGAVLNSTAFKTNLSDLYDMYEALFPDATIAFVHRGEIPHSSGTSKGYYDLYAGVAKELSEVDDSKLVINLRNRVRRWAPTASIDQTSSTYKVKGRWTTGTTAATGEYYLDYWISGTDTGHSLRLYKCTSGTTNRPSSALVANTNWVDATWKPNTSYAAGDVFGWYGANGMEAYLVTVAHTSSSSLADPLSTPDAANANCIPLGSHLADALHPSILQGGDTEADELFAVLSEMPDVSTTTGAINVVTLGGFAPGSTIASEFTSSTTDLSTAGWTVTVYRSGSATGETATIGAATANRLPYTYTFPEAYEVGNSFRVKLADVTGTVRAMHSGWIQASATGSGTITILTDAMDGVSPLNAEDEPRPIYKGRTCSLGYSFRDYSGDVEDGDTLTLRVMPLDSYEDIDATETLALVQTTTTCAIVDGYLTATFSLTAEQTESLPAGAKGDGATDYRLQVLAPSSGYPLLDRLCEVRRAMGTPA